MFLVFLRFPHRSAIIRMLPNWLLVPMARLFLRKVMHKSEKVATSLRTLSSVVEQEGVTRIDLLKIDVEGHEMEVLRVSAPLPGCSRAKQAVGSLLLFAARVGFSSTRASRKSTGL